MIIGISGVARCGKNSFSSFAREYLESKNFRCDEYAFANFLKSELSEFVRHHYGLDVYSDVTEEKAIFRDLLVAHGSIQRKRTNGSYWLEKVIDEVEVSISDHQFITDVRFPNEAERIKSLGGKVIHITRWTSNFIDYKEEYQPANAEEAKNDPLVKAAADYRFSWYDFKGAEEEAKNKVIELIKKVIND